MTSRVDERSFHVGQAFLAAAKSHWSTVLYRRLREEYREARAERGGSVSSVGEVADIVEPMTTYQYFAWLERHLQRMKYSGPYGLVPYYDSRRNEVLGALADATQPRVLELDPGVVAPAHYTSIDIHQHPGGLWSDPMAGVVYEHGARTTTPLLGKDHESLHHRLTNIVADRCNPRRILDMGCGFGKSTRPFIERFATAKVEGIDLSEACLRVAAAGVSPQDVDRVRYRQRNAAVSGFADGSFDLVTSTMFLHEMPPPAIRDVLRESFRVLEPGGITVHLDFWLLPDSFTRFLHYGHGRRNNEPYMQPLAELDLPQELRNAGFSDVEILPFSESGEDPAMDADAWRFPWTLIAGRKPPAHAAGRG